MRHLALIALLLLLLIGLGPAQFSAHAASPAVVQVTSQFTMDRYGYAVINETVRFVNNGTGTIQAPAVTVGLGNLSSKVVASNLTGTGFSMSTPPSPGGPYTIQGGQPVSAGGSAKFTLLALADGVVWKAKNGSLEVLTLSAPSLDIPTSTVKEIVLMPSLTKFKSPPLGLVEGSSTQYYNYTATVKNAASLSAVTSVRAISQIATQDFHPLHVYSASRTISVKGDGSPLVIDSITFSNMGTTQLSAFYVNSLSGPNSAITILPGPGPRLVGPIASSIVGGAINLGGIVVGYPTNGVPAGANYTLSYQYNLPQKYYSISGGQVTVKIPETAPITAFVDTYSLGMSLPAGAKVAIAPPQAVSNVTPWQKGGSATFGYSISVGWAVDAGVPAASAVFVLLLLGLFVSRASSGVVTEEGEEEEAEDTSTEVVSSMIQAFDEKTSLINGMWPEIAAKDPNELNREYFDELRGRLDTFRSRALQRLNEVKQKSTTQKFFELLSQIHATEREVDRAAKDKLNLYEQFYLRRMRKEVYDRLLPQYSKRLERALNQLSDELHIAQREAKLF